MANEPVVTVVGNLAADPEVRFGPSGKAVANFTVASTPRSYKDGEWVDGETLWQRCTLWGLPAENLADSARKGDQVIVLGRLTQRNWVDKDGTDRVSIELQADEVGLSVKFATVTAQKVKRQDHGNQPRQQGRPQGQRQRPANDDPWGSAPPARTGGHASGYSDEPPFHHAPDGYDGL